jgi:signal transduction histidine kinase
MITRVISSSANMKRFYIIFFTSFIVLSVLLYISSWWFLGGVAILVLITVYDFYNVRLQGFRSSVEELGMQVEDLQKQLDRSLAKEEKATLELVQIRQQKKQLLNSLSHEIRTPMNAVMGMSQLLKDSALTNEQGEYVDTIENSGKNLLTSIDEILVRDILEFSKLQGKDKTTEIIDFDLRDSIEEVINMFVTTASKKGIELLIDIDDDVPLQFSGDNRRLREILMNLSRTPLNILNKGRYF